MDNCTQQDIIIANKTGQFIDTPFGIHNIILEAKRGLGLAPGQWFGPRMISIVLRNIINKQEPISNFHLHVCLDNNIFLDEIAYQIQSLNQSVFILLPTRLGIDNI